MNGPLFRDDFDCDTCKTGVQSLGDLLTSDDAGSEAVTLLQGTLFCKDPGILSFHVKVFTDGDKNLHTPKLQ